MKHPVTDADIRTLYAQAVAAGNALTASTCEIALGLKGPITRNPHKCLTSVKRARASVELTIRNARGVS